MKMKIVCNGEQKEITPGTFLGEFLSTLGLDADAVVVECDGKILNRDEYDGFALQDGSAIELIRFVGGG